MNAEDAVDKVNKHEVMPVSLIIGDWKIYECAYNRGYYMVYHKRHWATWNGDVRSGHCKRCSAIMPEAIVQFHGVLSKL